MKILIKPADWSDPKEKRYLEESAKLVYESFTDFCDLVSSNKNSVCDNLIEQLQDNNSELGYSIILIAEETLAGISIYYPSSEIKMRQLVSLRYILKTRDAFSDVIEKLRSFSMNIEPIHIKNYMNWARLGVKKEYRGRGLATMLNNVMELDSKQKGFEYIGSHLNRNNVASFQMHLGRGFSRVSEKDYLFIAMMKKLS